MTHLVGATSTATYTATISLDSGASQNRIFLTGSSSANFTASATGTAQNLKLSIDSWGSVSNIKCCIYDQTASGDLLETVIINSSEGTGVITVALAGTTTITSGDDYRLGLYTDSNNAISMDADPSASEPWTYNSTSSGNYTTPQDPVVSGGWLSNSVYYFAIDDDAGGPAVVQADTTPEDSVLQSFTTTGLTGTITAASLGGKDILSLLSNTDPTTATTYTLDVSATETSIGQPRIGETSTLSVTATGGTATTNVVIQPKTGWTITTGASIDHTANGWAETVETDLSITLVDGNLAYMSEARGEALTAAFVYTGGTTVAFQSTDFVVQQGGSATTTATSEGGAFYPFGEAPSGGSGISSETISATAIGSTAIQSSTI